jgi:hypothetical protein
MILKNLFKHSFHSFFFHYNLFFSVFTKFYIDFLIYPSNQSYKRVKNQVRMKFLIQKSERRLIGFV